ncbi:MAG TPA: hypothetical protein VFH33_00050 [Candidatus Krumholzibacteria bacterium]|nr:hypothetical protein [Candidatus Krumholzibacteria bacterium]
MWRLLCIPALLLVGMGCEERQDDYYAAVESNTMWRGVFGNRTVEGSGRTEVDLPDNDPCVIASLQDQSGYLTVTVMSHVTGGSIMGIGGHDDRELQDTATTEASHGMVAVCAPTYQTEPSYDQ